jgi:NAD(P)H-quinone oxidoreductase subunit 5
MAYASLTQVGIIVVEIGCGLRYIALIHMIGHALMRTLQLLRAPSLLKDYHALENAIGENLPRRTNLWDQSVPEQERGWLYRFCLERGFLDSMLDKCVIRPFLLVFGWCGRMEKRWTQFLAGGRAVLPDHAATNSASLEDVP